MPSVITNSPVAGICRCAGAVSARPRRSQLALLDRRRFEAAAPFGFVGVQFADESLEGVVGTVVTALLDEILVIEMLWYLSPAPPR